MTYKQLRFLCCICFTVFLQEVNSRNNFNQVWEDKKAGNQDHERYKRSTRKYTGSKRKPPNVIFILADDTGYGDFKSFGHPVQEWGGIDRMVEEGMKFTQWYSPSPVCSPSRVATLTGRYPVRSGYFFPDPLPPVPPGSFIPPVFLQDSPGGMHRSEITIAEKVKEFGYTTGMVGKWHLGINKFNNTDGFHLPKNHGFDYVGSNLPLSTIQFCNPDVFSVEEMKPFCFLYNGSEIVQQPINLTTLTDRMINDAKGFITENKKKKFFLYISFAQTHKPLFCSPRFCGQSQRGDYGDNVNEMASAVSDILDLLADLKIARKTLVIFVSDNGGEVDLCPGGGDNGPFRGSKGTTFEAGIRVPAVAWWPDTIPAGSNSLSVISSMDLFPTLTNLILSDNFTEANDQTAYAGVDGVPINDILKHVPSYREPITHPETPRILYHYCNDEIFALRYGDIKVHYKTKALPPSNPPPDCDRKPLSLLSGEGDCTSFVTTQDPPLMYDLSVDPGEMYPLDVNSTENQALLTTIDQLKAAHLATVQPADALLLPRQPQLAPCCNPPSCLCNYDV